VRNSRNTRRYPDDGALSAAAGLIRKLLVFGFGVVCATAFSQSVPRGDAAESQVSTAASGPVISLWYSSTQRFGGMGVPQRRVNVLGRVTGPNGVSSLTYLLNGGGPFPLSVGPDSRRLAKSGDFNIDIPYTSLQNGANALTVIASDAFGTSTADATIYDLASSAWRRSYRLSWATPSSLFDSAQVVDGRWGVDVGGVRTYEFGYDRAIAIGDTLWDDYEVTALMTVHGIDSTAGAFGPVSAGPALGFLMRWKGHTSQPSFDPPITQPLSGYLPYGALGWYHWYTGFGNPGPNKWELIGNDLQLKSQNGIVPLRYEIPTYFKMRVKTIPGSGGQYSFKMWEAGESEPPGWMMSAQETLSDPQSGSFLILAHHVDVTIGVVRVEPLGIVTTPLLSAPANGATGQGLGLTLYWAPVQRAGRYHLQVSEDASFSTGLVVDDEDIMDPEYAVNGLSSAVDYYWRVRAINPDGSSEFSPPWSFRTSALAPTLLSPLHDASGLPTTVTVRWTQVVSATSYGLQVSTDTSFAGGVLVDDQNVLDTLKLVSGLPNGTPLYWRVRSRSGSATSGYTAPWRFTTIVGAPVLSLPSNGAASQPVAMTVRWHPAVGATRYTLQVAGDPGFGQASLLLNDSSLTDTLRPLSGLPYNSLFYWRVRGTNQGGVGAFSTTWSFRTALPSPTPLLPVQAATDQPLAIQLVWNRVTEATAYHLQLGKDSTFAPASLVKNDSMIVDSVRSVAGLSYLTTYYWRVAALNVDGRSAFSPVFRFTTAGQLPAPVVLLNPGASAVLSADTARFVWRSSLPGVTSYWFEFSPDTTFMFRFVDSTLVDTTTVRRQLASNNSYYWKVRAKNQSGWGPYSETRQFSVVVTGLQDHSDLPTVFAVHQNYPNPFNPSTRIGVSLPAAGEIRIIVYNALGEKVATLVDGSLPAGAHTFLFDGSGLASGIYFYRVMTPGTSVIKKMILLK
jgi:Secretion system C-terminal sorting domain